MLVEAPRLRGRSGIWFIDNLAALYALVKGDSREKDLNVMAEAIDALTFELQTRIYFEWVESASNWAHGISRDGMKDEWWQRNGIVPEKSAASRRLH